MHFAEVRHSVEYSAVALHDFHNIQFHRQQVPHQLQSLSLPPQTTNINRTTNIHYTVVNKNGTAESYDILSLHP